MMEISFITICNFFVSCKMILHSLFSIIAKMTQLSFVCEQEEANILRYNDHN